MYVYFLLVPQLQYTFFRRVTQDFKTKTILNPWGTFLKGRTYKF